MINFMSQVTKHQSILYNHLIVFVEGEEDAVHES